MVWTADNLKRMKKVAVNNKNKRNIIFSTFIATKTINGMIGVGGEVNGIKVIR